MPSNEHKPGEIIGKLREVEIVLSQGGTTAEACRSAEYEKSTPQRANITLGANIQVSASEKKTSADRIAKLRKVSFIANPLMQEA